jgi:hypothetical protein
MMRHTSAQLRRCLGRADIEAAVDLIGVGADDLAAVSLGERYGGVRFAGRSSTDDGDQWALRNIKMLRDVEGD